MFETSNTINDGSENISVGNVSNLLSCERKSLLTIKVSGTIKGKTNETHPRSSKMQSRIKALQNSEEFLRVLLTQNKQ